MTHDFPASDVRDFPAAAKNFPPRVLVVDDEPLIRWSLHETLADHGCSVEESGDGRGACGAIRDAAPPFDVVLLDFRLPDSDNLSLLASIRRLAPAARVILMTAFATSEMAREALALGAYRVVSKPFEMQDVARLVAEALRLA